MSSEFGSLAWWQSWLIEARTCLSHPISPVVLPEQSAYEKFIESPFQRGTLSPFVCRYLTVYAKYAGRAKCVRLQDLPPCETVDNAFIS